MVIDANGRAAASTKTSSELLGFAAATNGTFSGGTFTGTTNVSGLFSASTLGSATITGIISGGIFTNGTLAGNGLYITNLDGGNLRDGTISNAQVAATAAIADTKLATISTAGKVANSATTAASANTASAIVARNGSGNFTAGIVTANLAGNATTATTATNSPSGNIDTNLALKAPLASPTFTGIVTATNIANGLGLVATPSYTFTGDTDTGLWSSGGNTLNFSTAGLERVRIDSSGRLAIGTTSASQLMTINSDIALAAIAFQIGMNTKAFFGVSPSADDPISGMTSGDLGIRVQGTNDIFLSANSGSLGQFVLKNSGNVGIGTATPSSALHVAGSITTSTQTKTSNYTLLTADGGTTFADAAAGAVTITLPAASSTTIGRSYQVFKVDSSGNAVNIAPNGSDTLLAGSTTNTTAQANCLRVIGYSATAWIVNKTQ